MLFRFAVHNQAKVPCRKEAYKREREKVDRLFVCSLIHCAFYVFSLSVFPYLGTPYRRGPSFYLSVDALALVLHWERASNDRRQSYFDLSRTRAEAKQAIYERKRGKANLLRIKFGIASCFRWISFLYDRSVGRSSSSPVNALQCHEREKNFPLGNLLSTRGREVYKFQSEGPWILSSLLAFDLTLERTNDTWIRKNCSLAGHRCLS